LIRKRPPDGLSPLIRNKVLRQFTRLACPSATPPRLPAAESELVTLFEVLSTVPDPRRVCGRRYRLGMLLALCLVAVLGGARSLARTARFVTDGGRNLRAALGPYRVTPNASTPGRLPARLDGDAVDDAIGVSPARYCTDRAEEPGDMLVGLAVDGARAPPRGSSPTASLDADRGTGGGTGRRTFVGRRGSSSGHPVGRYQPRASWMLYVDMASKQVPVP
jgi:hypothetical protein